jgi:hypothetical protein
MRLAQHVTGSRKRFETSSLLAEDSLGLGGYCIYCADAFEWLADAQPCSVHAVVTDPPYGLVEYTAREL